MHPLAVHIADVLPTPWWVGGFVAAAALLAANARRLADAEVPRLALLSAVFFVASLIHLPIGGITSVHLLLNGLVGLILGRRAVLAIAIGLVLQAALVGHGGYSTLGVNICIMTLPAYLASALFAGLRRFPGVHRPLGRGLLVTACVVVWGWSLLAGVEMNVAELRGDAAAWLAHAAAWWAMKPWTFAVLVAAGAAVAVWERRLENNPDFPLGLLVGEVSVIATVALAALVLRLALPGTAGAVVPVIFVAHLPIAALEGVVCGFAVSFLLRVAPAMLGPVDREDLVERHFPLPQPDADQG
jgi:cobalt/nickel transport system permease protein